MRTSTSETVTQDPGRLRALLEREAIAAGFEAVAVTAPDAVPLAAGRLKSFVDAGRHGTMDWMRETLERRASPRALWPDVRAVIVLAMNYGPDADPRPELDLADRGYLSVYARHRDYHDVVKGKLKGVAQVFAARSGAAVKVFVDTAPVMEKPLAEAAGLGWQGKHTNLVSRTHGSWLFLGTIFTDAALEPDRPAAERCGSCRACLDACPTDAFPAPFQLDARRCISYLTIEHKGPVATEFREKLGNRIYGCDDCLAACPWNKFAQAAAEAKFHAREAMKGPKLRDLLALDDPGFRALFAGSPIKRIGRDRFLRNVLYAAGNAGEPALVEPCRANLGDPSPLVRGAAVWALSRLMAPAAFAALKAQALLAEPDSTVQEEWRALDPARGGAVCR